MSIALKRAYEQPASGDGYRVLVDRIWPRGISKDKSDIDEWLKGAAPSDELRKSFHKGAISWAEFRNRYLSELKFHRDELQRIAQLSRNKPVTLIFSSQDKEHNNAVVLKQYLKMLGAN
ncbi:MAG: DUF488 family protein [Gammaproteobacteria bacterium]